MSWNVPKTSKPYISISLNATGSCLDNLVLVWGLRCMVAIAYLHGIPGTYSFFHFWYVIHFLLEKVFKYQMLNICSIYLLVKEQSMTLRAYLPPNWGMNPDIIRELHARLLTDCKRTLTNFKYWLFFR